MDLQKFEKNIKRQFDKASLLALGKSYTNAHIEGYQKNAIKHKSNPKYIPQKIVNTPVPTLGFQLGTVN
jgi:hypothetical protein